MIAIEFEGRPYVLIGRTEGAITTPEDYRQGQCSYAHLYPDGTIMRFGQAIGTRADIVFGQEIPEPGPIFYGAWVNLLSHPSWVGPEA